MNICDKIKKFKTIKTNTVYCIHNIKNQKVYIGSTSTPYIRIKKHIESLKSNRHYNQYLQRSWNKHGENCFDFLVVEDNIKIENLLTREQFWIDFYNAYDKNYGYNNSPTAGSPKGYKHTPENKLKMSANRKGKNNSFYGKKHSKETIDKIKNHNSKLFKGENNPFYGKKHSKETIDKLRIKKSKEYIFIDKNGTIKNIIGLYKFAKENKLSIGLLCKYLNKGKINGLYRKHVRNDTKALENYDNTIGTAIYNKEFYLAI